VVEEAGVPGENHRPCGNILVKFEIIGPGWLNELGSWIT
jgi:hypothetical protein